MAQRIGTVASRYCWVADGGAVLLGNVIRGFHGGAVLLGNGIAGFYYGGPVFLRNLIASGSTHWNGGFQVLLGCGWWRCVIGECD